MRHLIRLPLAGAVCVLAYACGGETASPTVEAPTFAVSDGAHNGNPDFFFLPPLFKSPVNNPNYEPSAANLNLRPAVEICELGVAASDGSRDCIAGPPLKRFAPSQVTVSLSDQLYQVNWKTDETPLDVGQFYRIRVLVGSSLLGFADVDPVSSGRDLKNVQTNEYIPLQDGRTLPIKFRIESGALCAVDGTPCSSETINLAQGGQLELLGAGEDFRVDIPPGTTATYGGQTITDVTFNLEVCDGIDVDLPLYGPCLRISTYFDGTGSHELAFSKNLLISLCELNEQYHTPDETRQEGLITLHQQDGTLVRALPHAVPNCGDGTIGFSGWQWLRQLAARLLMPQSAFAATRTAALHVGGGGETGYLGAQCAPAPSAVMRGIMMAQVCPPSSPQASAGPQRVATATFTPALTVSDFQFALPAKMDYLNPSDAQRSAAPGTALPTAVKVTDLDGAAVQGATVRFIEPAIEGPGTVVGTAISDANGVAQILWTIRAGPNTVVATGRGIAAQNNYPGGVVRPFIPDVSKPTNEQEAVALGTGRVFFFATGGQADLIIESLTHSPAEPTSADLMEFGVTVKNQGTAATGPFYVVVTTTKDGAPLETTTLVGLATEGSSLAAGESRTLCCWRSTRAAGEYVQTAAADFHSNPDLNNQVPESNEENNTRSDRYSVSPVEVLPPDQQNLLDGEIGGQGIGRFNDTDGSPDPEGTSFDYQDAQTFIVSQSGRLSRIKVPLVNNQGATAGVTLQIVAVVDGVPDEGHSLGEVTIPASAIPTDFATIGVPAAWPTFDLTSLGISVTRGESLAFIVRSVSPVAYLFNPEFSSGYDNGSGFRRNRAISATWSALGDFGFQTFVVPN